VPPDGWAGARGALGLGHVGPAVQRLARYLHLPYS
jgi:hypothetical protein